MKKRLALIFLALFIFLCAACQYGQKRSYVHEISGLSKSPPSTKLEASPNYGFLYPYVVPLNYGSYVYGLVDSSGNIVVYPGYASVSWVSNYSHIRDRGAIKAVIALQNLYDGEPLGDYTLAAVNGSWVSKEDYSSLYPVKDGIIVRSANNDMAGIIDYNGKMVVECIYQGILNYNDGIILIYNSEGQYEYLTKSGKRAVPKTFEERCEGFYEGLAAVMEDGKYGYIDRTGDWVIAPQFDYASQFVSGFACVGIGNSYDNTRYGIINRKGYVVIPCVHISRFGLENGIFYSACTDDTGRPKKKYYKNSSSGFVEISRQEITFYDCEDKALYGKGKEFLLDDDDGYAEHLFHGVYYAIFKGLVTIDGELLWSANEGRLHTSTYNLGGSLVGTNIWMMDVFGEQRFFSLEVNEKYGIVDIRGNLILPAEYDRIFPVGNKFSVTKGHYTGIINADGSWLFKKSLLDYIPD